MGSPRSAVAAFALAALVVLALGAPAPSSASQDPVQAAIGNAQLQGLVTQSQATGWGQTYLDAITAVHQLGGNNRTQMAAALKIVRGIAHRQSLTAARMPFVFLVLRRNVQWWTRHRQPTAGSQGEPGAKGRVCTAPRAATSATAAAAARAAGEPTAGTARISFPGSGIVFEYYPGMGLQLQVNGTFGNANALLHTANPKKHAQALKILDEMRPLIAPRDGLDTWEYEFPFDGGVPPWASGLAQGTAIEAYTTAATTYHRPRDLALALTLAGLFGRTTPTGVRVPLGRDGNWYALYSFAPGQMVLNADLDAVVALFDLQAATRSPAVATLESAGLRAVSRRIKSFDTGKWSLYSAHGPLADLNYHVLNRDEAKALCMRTNVASICAAWHSFTHELQVQCPRPTPKAKPKPKPKKPATPTTPSGPPNPGGGVSSPTTTTTTPAPTTPTTPTTTTTTTPTTPAQTTPGGGVVAP